MEQELPGESDDLEDDYDELDDYDEMNLNNEDSSTETSTLDDEILEDNEEIGGEF